MIEVLCYLVICNLFQQGAELNCSRWSMVKSSEIQSIALQKENAEKLVVVRCPVREKK